MTTEITTEKKPGSETIIGKPTNRIDGPLKVTGAAKYSSDYNLEANGVRSSSLCHYCQWHHKID